MKNVLEWLENKTEQEKKKIAFIDPKDEISFGELEQKAKCIGTYISYLCDVRSAVGFYMEKNIDAVLLEGKIARILGVEEKSLGILISAVCQEADRKHVMEYTLSYYPSKRNKFVLKINV